MIGNGDGAALPLALLHQIKENIVNLHRNHCRGGSLTLPSAKRPLPYAADAEGRVGDPPLQIGFA